MTRPDYRRELLRDLLDVARNYHPDLTSADIIDVMQDAKTEIAWLDAQHDRAALARTVA